MVQAGLRSRFDYPLSVLSGWPRRAIAALCLLAAAVSAVGGHPRPVGRTSLVIAARVIPAGRPLTAADLRLATWPTDALPPSSLRLVSDAVGRRLAVPTARGEPVTSESLLEPALARALAAGKVATTIMLAAANQSAIVRAGSVVDLYSSSADGVLVDGRTVTQQASTKPIAENVQVLTVLPESSATGRPDQGPSLVVATEPATAARLADQSGGSFLATLIQPP